MCFKEETGPSLQAKRPPIEGGSSFSTSLSIFSSIHIGFGELPWLMAPLESGKSLGPKFGVQIWDPILEPKFGPT